MNQKGLNKLAKMKRRLKSFVSFTSSYLISFFFYMEKVFTAKIFNAYTNYISLKHRVCTTENFLSPVFSPSFWSSKHVTSWVSGRVASLCLHALLKHLFVVFHQKICIFIIFIYFLDKVSSLHNIILRNQLETVNGDKKLSVELDIHVNTNHGN